MARRHSGDCLELPTEGRLVTKPAVKGYLPEGVITVPQPIGGGLYPEPRQKLPGGNLQQGTHEAFKTAKREVRSRNKSTDPQGLIVMRTHMLDNRREFGVAGIIVRRRVEIPGHAGDTNDMPAPVPNGNLVREIPAYATIRVGDHFQPVSCFLPTGNDIGILLLVTCSQEWRKELPGSPTNQITRIFHPGALEKCVVGGEVAPLTVLNAEQDAIQSLEQLLHGFHSRGLG